jgi:DNA (cytosine-5)-methyltransferase 1
VLTHLDLCSGIGGFALAARWAGLQTIGFCEIDPWCQKVLAKHWPGVPQHGDLKSLQAALALEWAGEYGRVDLITGGYPCQPFSVAGQRKGSDDDRHLWPHILELIKGIRPRWCLFENVAGHITLGLDTVLSDLEAEGYSCWPAVIPAMAAGAKHRRDRVWIIASTQALAHSHNTGWSKHSRAITIQSQYTAAQCGSENWARGAWQTERSLGNALDGISRWLAESRGGGLLPFWIECELCEDLWCLTHAMHVYECQCGSPGDDSWFVGPGIANPWHSDWERGCPRVTEGEKQRTQKLKALGNAIVPQIAYQLMVSMLMAENQK